MKKSAKRSAKYVTWTITGVWVLGWGAIIALVFKVALTAGLENLNLKLPL
jgi:hypothetical protein